MNQIVSTFILHAHLPYVRDVQNNALEEIWLYEAMAETYIPLLWLLEKDSSQQKWTLSFSPTLMEMLADPLLQKRFITYVKRIESLLDLETETVVSQEEQELTHFYRNRYKQIKETFDKWNNNLLDAFRYYFESDKIECITTSASHAILPYLISEEGMRAQILEGLACFKRHFGKKPNGFWLPECAYTPEIDNILHKEGISYTFVDEHGVTSIVEYPENTVFPIKSPNGIVLFPRNQKLSQKVWSSSSGYPGDVDYREFYRDLGHDREYDYISPFLHREGIRSDTGVKYYCITGKEEKEFYNCELASFKVKQHAKDFIKALESEQNSFTNHMLPSVVLPFDAELFGHWWFEGPDWLYEVFSKSREVKYLTCSEYVKRYKDKVDTNTLSFSTWGRNGYGEVWLNEENAWFYRYSHHVEKELKIAVNDFAIGSELEKRTLRQMVREWLLLSGSDWAFMIDNKDCRQYAETRIVEHFSRFTALANHLYSQTITSDLINSFEQKYPFLSTIDLSVFQVENSLANYPINKNGLHVLMLSWEFPPMIVGGLARHVYDLSRELVKSGHIVTVVTTFVEGQPSYENFEGIHVYRVKGYQPNANDFLHWVGSFNMAFIDKVCELAQDLTFDIIHAHDWLVAVAAITLQSSLQKTLVATVHATEFGRNNGIFTYLQKKIHQKEERLAKEADSLIVCSDYMEDEVIRLFQLDPTKVHVLPNGVDPSMLKIDTHQYPSISLPFKEEYSHVIFSVGRIVPEKGFETIINAAPTILAKYPDVLFLIAGKGPMLYEYKRLVKNAGLDRNIIFLGYITDDERNRLFHECDMTLFPSLYEPFGIVALEGMVAGKPTIVSETGGLQDIVIHGQTGLIMCPGDAESLATQVMTLLDNKELSKRIGEQGKHAAETIYNWENIAIDTIQLYKESKRKFEFNSNESKLNLVETIIKGG